MDSDSISNIMRILREGHPDELSQLLRLPGSKIAETLQSYRDPTGKSLLCVAVDRGEHAREFTRLLLQEASVPPNEADEQNGQTPLFYAAKLSVDAVRVLLEERAEVDHVDTNFSQTALFYALRHRQNSCVQALLTARASLNTRDKNSQTAVFYAAKWLPECVEDVLDNGGEASVIDRNGRTPLFECMEPVAFQHPLERRCDPRAWPRAFQLLLERRCDPRACDIDRKTALFYVKDPRCCRLLIEARCEPNGRDSNGQSALFFAANDNHLDWARSLIDSGATAGIEDNNGQNPLWYACVDGGGKVKQQASVELCSLLVEKGHADPFLWDNADGTSIAELVMTRASNLSDPYSGAHGVIAAKTEEEREREKLKQKRVATATQNLAAYFESLHARRFSPSRQAKQRRIAQPSTGRRQRFCLVFNDPSDPTGVRKIPFNTPEYDAALQRLQSQCPWLHLENWPSDAPMTTGLP